MDSFKKKKYHFFITFILSSLVFTTSVLADDSEVSSVFYIPEFLRANTLQVNGGAEFLEGFIADETSWIQGVQAGNVTCNARLEIDSMLFIGTKTAVFENDCRITKSAYFYRPILLDIVTFKNIYNKNTIPPCNEVMRGALLVGIRDLGVNNQEDFLFLCSYWEGSYKWVKVDTKFKSE